MPPTQSDRARGGADARPAVVGIGASAGGLEALRTFFESVSADLGASYVIIMHLAPDRPSDLPEILQRWTTMPVRQVGDSREAKLEPDHVYVIAPDHTLEISDSSVGAAPFTTPRHERAAIDTFFKSLAEAHHDGFAVVLSGGGSDGVIGARAVKDAGGLVLVQDPADARHDSMPRSVIDAGLADVVLPVGDLASKLAELVSHRKTIKPIVSAGTPREEDERAALGEIVALLRDRTGHDFSRYKQTTIVRRILRRVHLAHLGGFRDYHRYLMSRPAETRALLGDLLISVTSFFRDSASWDALRTQVVGPLVDASDPDDPLRAWVAGCSTGEEAYSLAMLFADALAERNITRDLTIFATDIDELALATAREGIYPAASTADVPQPLLDRYFRPVNNRWQVTNGIRDRVVFAAHSLLRDPPFSRLNLITCRNLLIYLDRELQEQVEAVFHYALRDDGFLFLGTSETMPGGRFRAVDKEQRLFQPTRIGQRRLPSLLALPFQARPTSAYQAPRAASRRAADVHLESLEQLAPPSLLVDDRWEVLHLSPSAGRFLQPGGGAPLRSLTQLVRPELRETVRLALHHVFRTKERYLSRFVPVQFNGTPQRVAVLASFQPGDGGGALLLFLEGDEAGERPADDADRNQPHDSLSLERERLDEAEERIERMLADHHEADEELRAANEELQSLNEEYRSTTEELETSKEELQSINEELHTVNDELKTKLDEVSRARDDIENLMAATDIATLFLDRDLSVVRFTPRMARVFNLRPSDAGRPISDITHSLDYEELEDDSRTLLQSLAPLECEVSSRDGREFIARLRPYRTADDRIDGVVMTLIDVTRLKHTEARLRDSETRLAGELETAQGLHRMAMGVATATSTQAALDSIIEAATHLHGADFGTIQLWDDRAGALTTASLRGVGDATAVLLEALSLNDDLQAARARRTGLTVRIEDVDTDPTYLTSRALAAQAGYRAVQATPLRGGGGEVVGVLSTYYRAPRTFSERDGQVADLLAREAFGLIAARRQQDQVAELYRALKERTDTLEASEAQLRDQADELRRMDRTKEEFLSMLGHELRNPLAAILSSVSLIEADSDGLPPEAPARRAMTIIGRQVRHINRLVDDLLDMTRINRGKLMLQREPTDATASIRAVVESLQPRLSAAKIDVRLELPETPLVLDVDPERLTQVLDNLLTNAMAYTNRGGTITVRAGIEGQQGRIAVIDTGVGLEQDDLDRIFQPYKQVDVGDGRHSLGLGLGLTLVRSIVELHGGTIKASSDGRNTGARFDVALPAAASARPHAPPAPSRPPSSRRVLVVDDEEDVAASFGAILDRLGQQTTVVTSGQAALEAAGQQAFDVAFVDLSMPGMTGYELASELRDRFAKTQLTLVSLSGYGRSAGMDSETVDCFDTHLLKPATVEMVTAVLNGLSQADAD